MNAWSRGIVVLLALFLLFGSVQCMAACSIDACQTSSQGNLPPCHHHHAPASHFPSACSHPMTMLDARQPSAASITLADLITIPFLPVTSSLPAAAMGEVLTVHASSPPGVSALSTVVLRI